MDCGLGCGTLISFFFFQGVSSTLQLTQSGSLIVNPGGSFKLTCIVSGVEVSGWYWGWNRQSPGKKLEWLGGISSTAAEAQTYYNTAFSHRIGITRDTSKNEFYLQLCSLNPADTAVYYCARERKGHDELEQWSIWTKTTRELRHFHTFRIL
uniref:Ig-like domain-containing protein n=1 Tax=Anolis carolinensis TaxID=28377 RepID=A0A803SS15_ANOCA